MAEINRYCVYILLCSDGSYYTGVTSNLDVRLAQHYSGFYPDCYTFLSRPVELKCVERFPEPLQAIAREKQIKGWSRKKKEALIMQNWEALKRLAKSLRQPPGPGDGAS